MMAPPTTDEVCHTIFAPRVLTWLDLRSERSLAGRYRGGGLMVRSRVILPAITTTASKNEPSSPSVEQMLKRILFVVSHRHDSASLWTAYNLHIDRDDGSSSSLRLLLTESNHQ
jgi:hypothetical protein